MRTIILIDPSAEVRSFVRDALALAGLHVEAASDAGEAVHRLRGARPELVLWDVTGSERDLEGALARLRAGFPGAAVIAVSGDGCPGEPAEDPLEAAERAGAWGCLAKPFTLIDLLVAVAAWRGSGAALAELVDPEPEPPSPSEAFRGPHRLSAPAQLANGSLPTEAGGR